MSLEADYALDQRSGSYLKIDPMSALNSTWNKGEAPIQGTSTYEGLLALTVAVQRRAASEGQSCCHSSSAVTCRLRSSCCARAGNASTASIAAISPRRCRSVVSKSTHRRPFVGSITMSRRSRGASVNVRDPGRARSVWMRHTYGLVSAGDICFSLSTSTVSGSTSY